MVFDPWKGPWAVGWIALGACLLAACGDEAVPLPRSVQIRFKAHVLGQPFACGQTFEGVGSPRVSITPRDFRLYVHDVRLVKDDGADVPVSLVRDTHQYRDVALLDFEDGTGACTEGDLATHTVVTGEVPSGTYRGLRFTLGVPEDLNHQSLTALPSPLDRSALYWSWRMGHVFLAATTRWASGSGVTDHFTHVGSTNCEGDPEAGKPVTACAKPNRPRYEFLDFDVDQNAVTVDLGALKAGSDVRASSGCHSFTEECMPAFRNLGIDWSSGALTPETQTFFGVQ